MNTQLPWKWYIKPVLPIVLTGTALLAAFLLLLPDPLFSLLHENYSRMSLQSAIYVMALMALSAVYQAAIWLMLYRAWRFHLSQGVPLAKHASPMVLSAALCILPIALMPTLLVVTGLRSSLQDAMENPWFPLLATTEYRFCFHWFVLQALIFLGWLAVWARWRCSYKDGFMTVGICVLCHLLAIGTYMSISLVSIDRFSLLQISFLSVLVLTVLVPIRAQLLDMEAL